MCERRVRRTIARCAAIPTAELVSTVAGHYPGGLQKSPKPRAGGSSKITDFRPPLAAGPGRGGTPGELENQRFPPPPGRWPGEGGGPGDPWGDPPRRARGPGGRKKSRGLQGRHNQSIPVARAQVSRIGELLNTVPGVHPRAGQVPPPGGLVRGSAPQIPPNWPIWRPPGGSYPLASPWPKIDPPWPGPWPTPGRPVADPWPPDRRIWETPGGSDPEIWPIQGSATLGLASRPPTTDPRGRWIADGRWPMASHPMDDRSMDQPMVGDLRSPMID